MKLVNKRKLDLPQMADLENAAAGAERNTADVEDIMAAIVEIGDMLAAQDDAIVELAELISE